MSATALGVFAFFFLLVTVLGFVAARWRAGDLSLLHEWGLGGRRFGTFVTWFLLGGDLYTAYTVIAVPALVYGKGAFGFFALPYTIIAYPFVYATMPRLWNVCRRRGYVTLADFAQGRYGSRGLALAIAFTGVLATLPYIALQLIGLQAVFGAMGFDAIAHGSEIALIVAFLLLAIYTYSSGLRAPALIAFVKDAMIYVFVIAAVIVIPLRLGGYRAIFTAADHHFRTATGGGALLGAGQQAAFSTLALGSALALFLYPHAVTGLLSASGPRVIRRNAIFLPAYSLVLGLIALLGYMGIAAGVTVHNPNEIVPVLFRRMFPDWFFGFCMAAVALGALVPSAIMSIGAANLVVRNIWRPYIDPAMSAQRESTVAKVISMAVKFGALAFVLLLPVRFALDLQLLGGVWMLQIFPAVIFGLFTRWFRPPALLAGWATGMALGSGLSFTPTGISPLHALPWIGAVYNGLTALAVNVAVAALGSLSGAGKRVGDETSPTDYEEGRGGDSILNN